MPKSTIFRSVQSKGFEELRPIYDQCSTVFQEILKDETLRKKMEKVPLEEVDEDGKKKKRLMGHLFHDFGHILGNPLSGKVCNSAWYMRIIIFNLVSLLRSRADQVKIYKLLQKYQFKICSDLRKELAENELYPSNTNLKNLCQAKEMPHLPESAVFRLDYAYSDKQMCVFDCEKLEFSVQVRTNKEAKKTGLPEWKTFNLVLPSFIREQAAGKIAKPLFYKDKTGKLICQIPYEVKPEKHPEFKNILGVDLGKVKPYSAVVLYRDKTYSNEITPSKELMNLYEKLIRINENIDRNYQKYKRAKAYQKKDEGDTRRQQARWFNYRSAREKRTRIKEEAEWLMAEEIVEIAKRNQCKEIHMENLTWVNNKGGKWDFSMIRDRVMQVAELHGIEVVFVNPCNTSCRHPLTHELGKESGRSIVFKDGTRVDRDQLAALNIALTKKEKKKGEKTKTKIQKTELKPVSSERLVRKEKRRESSRNRKKKQYDFKNKKRMHQIAAFCRKPAGRAFQDLSALTVQRKTCFFEGYDDSNLLPKGFLKYNKLQFVPS